MLKRLALAAVLTASLITIGNTANASAAGGARPQAPTATIEHRSTVYHWHTIEPYPGYSMSCLFSPAGSIVYCV